MRILGIETSCDDTAAAVVENGRHLISSWRSSSATIQQKFGGVVPEVAAREHVLSILPTVRDALHAAGMDWQDIDGVAVTRGPGLIGALLVGVTFAKAVGAALNRPVVGVHHLEAHLYANALMAPIQFPALALIVSGGHTTLAYWTDHGQLAVLGETLDDAAGEAFDKGARILGLPYPGGPAIERLADQARPDRLMSLPVARLGADSLNFSFSGVKTRLRQLAAEAPDRAPELAFALQEAVAEALVRNIERAYEKYPVAHLYLAGGVSANRRVREKLGEWASRRHVTLHVPPVELCTDNGAMVAALGYYRLTQGECLGREEGPKTPWPLREAISGARGEESGTCC